MTPTQYDLILELYAGYPEAYDSLDEDIKEAFIRCLLDDSIQKAQRKQVQLQLPQ